MHSSTFSLYLGLLLSANYLAVNANFQQRALCDPGTWSATGNTPCILCLPGTFKSSFGSGSCISARPGHFVQGVRATTDTPCPPGSYASVSGATSCSPCPAGKQCPGSGTSVPGTCPPGTFSGTGATSCALCQAGSFTSLSGSSTCCTCCAGFYSNGARTECTKCPGATPYSAPGSSNPGACSGSGTTTPALSCQQDPISRVCPAPVGLPTGVLTRANVRRQVCPKSTQKNCPIYKNTKGTTMLAGYECVDVANDLESCGGCVDFSRDGRRSEDGGRDCSAIPGVDTVKCMLGKCVIKRCRSGYKKARFGDGCIPTMSFLEQTRRGLRR
ncbi:hypothetical protein BD779DRAFT_603412 [Infundibulicybe gibba]|nr:hypothetical protein BD779DRAFT_603412 [Infundibulicybe gibba]